MQQQSCAYAYGCASDCGYQRFAGMADGPQKLKYRRIFLLGRILQKIFEVITRSKYLRLAGKHNDAHRRVRFGVLEGIGHVLIHGGSDGVLAFDAVEREGKDALLFGDVDFHMSPDKKSRTVSIRTACF